MSPSEGFDPELVAASGERRREERQRDEDPGSADSGHRERCSPHLGKVERAVTESKRLSQALPARLHAPRARVRCACDGEAWVGPLSSAPPSSLASPLRRPRETRAQDAARTRPPLGRSPPRHPPVPLGSVEPSLLSRSRPTAAHSTLRADPPGRVFRTQPGHSLQRRARRRSVRTPLPLHAVPTRETDLPPGSVASALSLARLLMFAACKRLARYTYALSHSRLTRIPTAQTSRAPSTTRPRSRRPTRRTRRTTGPLSASSAPPSSPSSAPPPSRLPTPLLTASSAPPSSPTRTSCVGSLSPSPARFPP